MTRTRPLWIRLSVLAALIAAAGNIAGLSMIHRIYGAETAAFVDQCVAQDIINLSVVAPATIVLAYLTARGSVRAFVCWLGCLGFTVYSYVIYSFSIHFGPLFLPWVAVLGLAAYAFVGGFVGGDRTAVAAAFGRGPIRLAACTQIVVGLAFGLLWLSEIVPELVEGNPSTSAAALNLPTNPVHVLDLAVFLPAVVVSGFLALRRAPLGYVTSAPALVFVSLTSLPILITPLVQLGFGRDPAWAIELPIGTVLAVTVLALCSPAHRRLTRPD